MEYFFKFHAIRNFIVHLFDNQVNENLKIKKKQNSIKDNSSQGVVLNFIYN